MLHPIQTANESTPRKLNKPAHERVEMSRQELVVYTDESGSGGHRRGGGDHGDHGGR